MTVGIYTKVSVARNSTEWTVLWFVALTRYNPHHLLLLQFSLRRAFELDRPIACLARSATLLFLAAGAVPELVLVDTFALVKLYPLLHLVFPRRTTDVFVAARLLMRTAASL